MAKYLEPDFLDQLNDEFCTRINDSPFSDKEKDSYREITKIALQVFVVAFNKAIKEGYL